MPFSVFYSWQSDLPSGSNRNFILSVLEKCASTLKDGQGEPLIVVDRDTAGLPGSPDIVESILRKINEAVVFVADISIVQRGAPRLLDEEGFQDSESTRIRPTPNPNVLFELGYAVKTMGWKRIVLIFNAAYGRQEELPFDLQKKRHFAYSLGPCDDRTEERKKVQGGLQQAITATIEAHMDAEASPVPSPAQELESGLEKGDPRISARVREVWSWTLSHLTEVMPWNEPEFHAKLWSDEEVLGALGRSLPGSSEFAHACELASLFGSLDASLHLFRGFADLMRCYDLPAGYAGNWSPTNYDYFKFLGHEMMATLVGKLVAHERYDIMDEILGEPLGTDRYGNEQDFTDVSRHLKILEQRSRRTRRLSVHADTLLLRHDDPHSALGTLAPLAELRAGDLFLFLRRPFRGPDHEAGWRPWSCQFQREAPDFLRRARRRRYAERLLGPLQLRSLEDLRNRVEEGKRILAGLFSDGYRSHAMFLAQIDPMQLGVE